MSSVERILERGQFTNSYKFALLRALAAYGKEPGTGEVIVETEWLAEQFISYYWQLAVRFNVRQATVPDKDPVVMKYIRAMVDQRGLSPETRLTDFKKNSPNEYFRLAKMVAANSFGDVVSRFHTVGRTKVEPALYKEVGGGLCISADARAFLNSKSKSLDMLAIGSWVRFTEKFTSAPRLYEKIRGLPPKRLALKSYREFFQNTLRMSNCFYCGLEFLSQPHVDHVVPWSFVAEDKVWNLVLSCDRCNSATEKGSQTPPDRFIQDLIGRNQKLLAMDTSALPKRINSELSEWRAGGLKNHIELLVNRCRADGFGLWDIDVDC